MTGPPRAAWLLPGLFLLFACSCRRADFLFVDTETRTLAVRRQAEGPRFLLPRRAPQSADGRAFYLRYHEPPRPVLLRLWGEDGAPAAEAVLPAGGGEAARKYVFLPRRTVLTAFSLHPAPGESGPAELEILESGLGEAVRGYAAGEEERVLGTQIDRARSLPEEFSVSFSPNAAEADPGGDWGLRIDLEAGPPSAGPAGRGGGELDLLFGAPGRSFTVRLTPRPGAQSQSFYAGVLPFRPAALTVVPAADRDAAAGAAAVAPAGRRAIHFRITGAEFFSLPPAGPDVGDPDATGAVQPLSADPELVLRYDPERWRFEDYELFRWNRFPDVLIFDIAGYEVQDRYFKRLAFFVEKKGFRGRLVSLEEVRNRHGYNAHDYRAEDLARFFTLAAGGETLLSAEEALLRRVLLANDVIRAGENGFLPGRGALLSVSRGSPPALRRHLLTHECLHGVFFASEAYRRACEEAWSRRSDAEREFWQVFLDWQGYDIGDRQLVINEFQAYLLQQPRQGLHYYFQVLTRDRLVSRYPEREAEIRRLVEQAGAGLAEAHGQLEQALRRTAGLEAGQVNGLSFPAAEDPPAD